MSENAYATDDEEQDAHTATYANLARAAVWRHMSAHLMHADDPWADKVLDVLAEVHRKLSDMADDECRLRPGMKEIGKAYAKAFAARFKPAEGVEFAGAAEPELDDAFRP